MDRFEAMATFATIADAGSLTAAGRRLGVPLATVSRRLAELELHLGARLFVRSTRRIALTDAGQLYLVACKKILDDVDTADRAAVGEYSAPRGELVVTAPIAFGRTFLLPIVVDFLAKYPEINVRMNLTDRNSHLLDEQVDLALRIGSLPDSSMISTQVGTVRRVVCGSPRFFETNGLPKTPADMQAQSCVTFDALSSAETWKFRIDGLEAGIVVRPRLAVNTAEAAVDAAIAGVGATQVVHYQAAGAIRTGMLRTVLEPFEVEPDPVSLVYFGGGAIPLKLRTFIDFAGPRLRQQLVSLNS